MVFNETDIKTSLLIPKEFKENPKDVIIAIEFAKKQGKTLGTTLVAFDYAIKFNQSPLTILQAIYEVNGKIGWSADFLLVLLRTVYKKIDFVWDETQKTNPGIKIVATNEDGEQIDCEMCYYLGWKKETEHWAKMPRTMLKRRAITLFARTNNPELFSNCYDVSELLDITNITPKENETITVKAEVVETKELAAKKIFTATPNNKKGYF